jgi:hypothetical protein
MFATTTPRPSRDQIRGQLVAYGCPVPGDGNGNGFSGGGYRTVCVRICDGYYFPLENGVSSDRFQADAQKCDAMYGGQGQAQLFVMQTGGDIASAQPVNGGKTYGSQPYAFAYRTGYDEQCVGELQSGIESLLSKTSATAPSGPAKTASGDPIAIPHVRPTPFEDPETLANAAGELHPQAAAKPAVTATADASGRTGSNIRVVGAAYYNQILQQQTLAKAGPQSAANPEGADPATAPAP